MLFYFTNIDICPSYTHAAFSIMFLSDYGYVIQSVCRYPIGLPQTWVSIYITLPCEDSYLVKAFTKFKFKFLFKFLLNLL